MKILVINGPNLNLLGSREPPIYGSTPLAELETSLRSQARELGLDIDFFQSNNEGLIIDRIHAARNEGVQFIVLNPGGFTHTSVAIRDALLGVAIPFVEVHISNIYKREPFRHHSYFSDVAEAVICGFGTFGYNLALQYIHTKLKKLS